MPVAYDDKLIFTRAKYVIMAFAVIYISWTYTSSARQVSAVINKLSRKSHSYYQLSPEVAPLGTNMMEI